MKCIVPGTNIKVFGRAVHSLSKIGEELYIEPLDHGLALRTVNSSRSAYACFLFAPSFFQHYDDGSGQISSQDSDDTLRCKIGMKVSKDIFYRHIKRWDSLSVMTVFKSLSNLEKTVDQCKIKLNMKESRLVFQLHCRHGIVKTHNLAFIECETLQAVFSKDMCVNSLTASSKLLCDAVLNFQNNQEEITLTVNPEKITLKNYVDDEPDPSKVMHTNLTLDPDEFDNCQVGVDTEVTFCLKELRAILAFSEVTTLPLTLKFETAGRPIVFSIDSDSTFEANFVLASLAEQSELSQTQSRMSSQKRPVPRSRSTQPRPSASTSRSSDIPSNRQKSQMNAPNRSNNHTDRSQRLESAYNELMEDDEEFTEIQIEHNTTVKICGQIDNTTKVGDNTIQSRDNTKVGDKTVQSRDNTKLGDKTVQSRNNTVQSRDNTKVGDKTVQSRLDNVRSDGDNKDNTAAEADNENDSLVPTSSQGDSQSPVIPALGTKAKILLDATITEDVDMAEGSDLDDTIPGTPPAKRFRSIFFGSSQSQSQTVPNASTSRVLAADTDDEGD